MNPSVTKNARKSFEKARKVRLAELQAIYNVDKKHLHKERNRLRAKETLNKIDRVKRLDIVRSLDFFIQKSVKILRNTLIYLNDPDYHYFVRQVLKNKFNCKTEKQFQNTYKDFGSIAALLLNDPLGVDGAKAKLNISGDIGEVGGSTRSSFNETSDIFLGTINDAIFEQDYEEHPNSSASQVLIRTIIHESVHRLNFIEKDRAGPALARKIGSLVSDDIGEIYELKKDSGFEKLTSLEHRTNADSYVAFYMTVSKARIRVRNATVTTERLEALELREIMDGDTLWDLSEFFYGDGRQWPRIWEVNKDTLKSGNPHRIYPDEVVLIPYE